MIRVDEQLIRNGGNQLGVLVMAGGLVAYFVEPEAGAEIFGIVLGGCVAYILSATRLRGKTETGETGNLPGR